MRDENIQISAGDEVESLVLTALREGIEESGLALEHIVQLYDVGPYAFTSAKTGREKWMWLFAARMNTEDGFTGEVAPSTAACSWLTAEEFTIAGRGDQLYILRDIEARLPKE